MKLALLILLSSVGLFGEDGFQFTSDSAVSRRVACRIYANGIVEIPQGKEQECWEGVVKSHNHNMDDPDFHKVQDRSVRLVAAKLGKHVFGCVIKQSEVEYAK